MKFHLASWIVAIEFAKKLFDEVEIYSDVQGKKILKSI
jgi:hypothetical protein